MTIWMLHEYFKFSVIRKGLLILSMAQSTPKKMSVRNSVCSLCSGAYKRRHMLQTLDLETLKYVASSHGFLIFPQVL